MPKKEERIETLQIAALGDGQNPKSTEEETAKNSNLDPEAAVPSAEAKGNPPEQADQLHMVVLPGAVIDEDSSA